MAVIRFKVSTGEEFSVSNAFYGASGPMGVQDANVQASFLLTKLVSITTDQGYTVNTSQIVYQWVAE